MKETRGGKGVVEQMMAVLLKPAIFNFLPLPILAECLETLLCGV